MGLPIIRRRQNGFTLIELLIVIAIIAILISIGLASYTRVQKSSRDTQRRSDLHNVAGALENFYADYNRYPNGPGGKIHDTACGNTDLAWGTDGLVCGGKTYLKQLPNNPIGSDYFYKSTGQTYCLAVDLETIGLGALDCGGTNYNFRLTQSD